jgi:histidinol-phosphate aminotransferase
MSLAERLARPEILALPPVDIAGAPVAGTIRLDANENPFGSLVSGHPAINRYPDPQPAELRRRMADLYGVAPESLWVTRGSDDAIDLLIRAFCRAGVDSIGIVEPTFSAYAQFARVQGAEVIATRLTDDLKFDPDAVLAAMVPAAPKLLFLCTPNNPTGTPVDPADVRRIAAALPDTLVVADEAYGEFSDYPSLAVEAGPIDNLVVLKTLSKAYGLAGARVGCAIADPSIIDLLARVSPPYPMPGPSIAAALATLGPERMPVHAERIARLLAERDRLAEQLAGAAEVRRVQAGGNFLFLEVERPEELAQRLAAAAIRVRFRPHAAHRPGHRPRPRRAAADRQRHPFLRPHVGSGRRARRVQPGAGLPRRPRNRPAPQRRGHRHRARHRAQAGAGRQAGHRAVRLRAADGRDQGRGADRPVRPALRAVRGQLRHLRGGRLADRAGAACLPQPGR